MLTKKYTDPVIFYIELIQKEKSDILIIPNTLYNFKNFNFNKSLGIISFQVSENSTDYFWNIDKDNTVINLFYLSQDPQINLFKKYFLESNKIKFSENDFIFNTQPLKDSDNILKKDFTKYYIMGASILIGSFLLFSKKGKNNAKQKNK